jgi:putative tryptophan/tyrosine transport system substrate-binding protein
MRRRDFITIVGTTAIPWVLLAHAEQAMPVIGFLNIGTPEGRERALAAFRKGLEDNGYLEGRNVAIEYRWTRGNYDLLSRYLADLIHMNVSVLVTGASDVPAMAAKQATRTIPIVALVAGDPVKMGLVESINHPGGNLTAVGLFTASANVFIGKRVELIREVVPNARIVGWLPDANIGDYRDEMNAVRAATTELGLRLETAEVRTARDIEPAVASLLAQGANVLLEAGPIFNNDRARLADIEKRRHVPWIFENRDFVIAGGLMSYGTDPAEAYYQQGMYAGRILHGDKAGDLPVTTPTKIELVINLKTAKALGLTIPTTLLATADEVIE